MSTKVLIVVAALAWGIWGFALKKANAHMPPLAGYIVLAGAQLVLLPIYFVVARALGVPLSFPTTGALWAGGAALCVGVGTIALLTAMKTTDASAAVALTASYPVVTLVLAVIFLGEPITLSRVAGIGLVAAGAVILGR